MFTFNHSGKIGDILYSLYFCKELSESLGEKQFNFHIQTNLKQSNGLIGMSVQSSNFLKPLLETQDYINEITIGDEVPNKEGVIDLVGMRNLSINIFTKDIRSWYYNLVANHLPKQFWKPILKVEPNYRFKDKIIFSWTDRYLNLYMDYKYIQEFKDHLVFVGLRKEYEEFSEKYFEVQYLPCSSMLEIAQYMAGAHGVLGCPGGNYTIAECLKVPRIVTSPEWIDDWDDDGKPIKDAGPVNVHPLGGWSEFAVTNQKLYFSLKELINYKKDVEYVYV